jgi:hypothetical protein
VAIGVCVDAADNERLLVLHPVPAVLSIREGGPVGKGGHNSDEALVASRFLSGHAPPDPTAQMGDQRRPAQSRQVPTNDTNRVNLCAGQTPGQTPNLIFTVCATASREGRSAAIGCWGATFTESHDRHGYIGAVATDSSTTPGEVDVLVIGAGQAGLAMGCHLAERGLSFVVADANPEVGHVWRPRWESLLLFTAGQFNNLPGMSFPAAPDSYPGKDEVAEFLRSYVRSSISQSG